MAWLRATSADVPRMVVPQRSGVPALHARARPMIDVCDPGGVCETSPGSQLMITAFDARGAEQAVHDHLVESNTAMVREFFEGRATM